MKTFHFELGHEAKRLLTVAELREKLNQYPDDMPVAAMWEGQYMPLGFHAETVEYHAGNQDEKCEILLLDAEND